jgi:hypothetical protein
LFPSRTLIVINGQIGKHNTSNTIGLTLFAEIQAPSGFCQSDPSNKAEVTCKEFPGHKVAGKFSPLNILLEKPY